jgi:KaiC/GvpD/RAD55 family RecA-like ATPase
MELIKNLENLGCTTMLSSEITSGALAYESFSVEEYLSEVVIRMHVVRVAGGRIRAIEVLKMRGGKHDDMLRPYAITDAGMVVYPRETIIDSDAINAAAMM